MWQNLYFVQLWSTPQNDIDKFIWLSGNGVHGFYTTGGSAIIFTKHYLTRYQNILEICAGLFTPLITPRVDRTSVKSYAKIFGSSITFLPKRKVKTQVVLTKVH